MYLLNSYLHSVGEQRRLHLREVREWDAIQPRLRSEYVFLMMMT